MKATAKELGFNSKRLLDAISRGEEVIISYRSKPCAKLIPYSEKKKRLLKTNCLESGKTRIQFRMWLPMSFD